MKLTKTKTKEFFKLIKNENIDTYDECVAMLNDYPELTNEIVSGMSKGTDGCSSLMLAVNYHKFKFALELIKNGADVNFIDNSPHRTDYCPIFICLLERLRNCIVFENTISIAEGIKVWELMESNGLDYSLKSIVTDGINKPENCIEAYIRFVTVGYEYKHKIHEEIKKDPYSLKYQYSEQSREISKEKLYKSIMEKLVSCIDEELFMEIDANKHRNSGNLYKIEHEKFIIIDYFSVEIANKYLSKKFGRSIKNIDDDSLIEMFKGYESIVRTIQIKMAKNDLFFYLFNDFIGGADDDEMSLKYSKTNLNDAEQRHFFIKQKLKPFYENSFDEAQKYSFKNLLQALINGSETITNQEINNQLYPFDFPEDFLMFCIDIQAIFFKK